MTACGQTISEKVIRRLMKEEGLVVHSVKRKKYSSYQGEISPAVENVVARDFHADHPNEKWLTDITEFHIPAGKIYLSPLIDCFDGMPVSWTIGTSPDAELVNTMLDEGIKTLSGEERPLVHSDYAEEKSFTEELLRSLKYHLSVKIFGIVFYTWITKRRCFKYGSRYDLFITH